MESLPREAEALRAAFSDWSCWASQLLHLFKIAAAQVTLGLEKFSRLPGKSLLLFQDENEGVVHLSCSLT